MQNVLSFENDGKKYVSKPFDFETMCLINDRHGEDGVGIMRMTAGAVNYMFEGTEATEDIISKLAPSVRSRLCREVWNMYTEAIKNG